MPIWISREKLLVTTVTEPRDSAAGNRWGLLIVSIQVALVLLAVYRFRIVENFGFTDIVPLVMAGYLIHAVLPMRYRQTFFLLLSLAAIMIILPFPYNVILIFSGLGIIGICHLPIPYVARVVLLLMVAVVLAMLRNGWNVFPEAHDLATLVIPTLGALFMFRLIIYMYDLQHEKSPVPISTRLSYFFMLPNICFLLYPVIDYRTFQRSHYNADDVEIYQKGALWILRGLVHLLLYRAVYGIISPSPASVHNFGDVLEYMLATYLLYLRISGQFHLIVGVLCLFGFNLPETHRLFYLASGFNDFWRRINIYWKDFMMKIVYYPVFVRVRRLGMIPAITIATLAVFIGTWTLHSYQWFWLRGKFPVTMPDIIFWGMLAVFVVANSILQTKSPQRRTLGRSGWSLRTAIVTSVKTVSFFLLMCLLWSLWNSATVGQWINVVSKSGLYASSDFYLLTVVLLAAVVIGVVVQYLASNKAFNEALPLRSFAHSPAYVVVVSVALLGLTYEQATSRLPDASVTIVAVIQKDRLNVHDTELVERGYYEDLLDNPSFTSTLSIVRSESQRPRTKDWVRIRDAEFVEMTNDFLEFRLLPSYSGTFKDAEFSTNSWGIRDQAYPLEKSPHTLRIALLGASMEMAAGVRNSEVYEAIVEEKLNNQPGNRAYETVELMNFSIGGYGMTQKVLLLDEFVARFDPDIVMLPIYNTEDTRTLTHMTNVIRNGAAVPYPELSALLEDVGIDSETPVAEIRLRLRPKIDDIINWSFVKLREIGVQRGYRILPVYLPLIRELQTTVDESRRDKLLYGLAAANLTVLNLEHVFNDRNLSEIQLAAWDTHLNGRGHRIVADALYREFQKMPLHGTISNE